ncbi:hypothetical protein EXIGLDRAFT_846663 [Exidia glandulosa HHB12029]|uniref:Protein kinase domain-containing protein n=1 Tax=Exidia glandulosa HHB12029 TaxID=1314781 RepID=A0A166NLJ9_EXIGL|nr:hypothetical protein EXIGLDRAFT_846663 [Exidia glandulosa HHB12029]
MAGDVEEWPPSLEDWRLYPTDPTPSSMWNCYLWRAMIPAFTSQGVALYIPDFDFHLPFIRRPPNPDQIHIPPGAYETQPGTYERTMQQRAASVYPATLLSDGRDVVVRVVSKGSIASRELQILRHLSSEPQKSDPRNHASPTLRELVYEDWTFAVIPRFSLSPVGLSSTWEGNWFATAEELFDFVVQILEGFSFLHDQLIAHQDISAENIVVNHVGARAVGFLSQFPCRYYIIDFELAVQFPKNSTLSERRVVGPPVKNFNPRRLPPEVGEAPHCPFAADVWQLGLLFFRRFPSGPEAVVQSARAMLTPLPADRPSMQAALAAIVNAQNLLSMEEKAATVVRDTRFDYSQGVEEYNQALETFLRSDDNSGNS